MEELTTKQKIRRLLINKYSIILFLFAIIYIFIGDQSLIKRMAKARELRAIEKDSTSQQRDRASGEYAQLARYQG